MNWKPHLPEIFLGVSLAVIAVEASLGGIAMVRARYRHATPSHPWECRPATLR